MCRAYSIWRLYNLRREWYASIRNNKPQSDDFAQNLLQRTGIIKIEGLFRYRGTRGGRRKQRPIKVRISRGLTSSSRHRIKSPVIHPRRLLTPISQIVENPTKTPPLTNLRPKSNKTFPGAIYVVNARSLAKAHAIDQLQAELIGYGIDIAIVTETFFKK